MGTVVEALLKFLQAFLEFSTALLAFLSVYDWRSSYLEKKKIEAADRSVEAIDRAVALCNAYNRRTFFRTSQSGNWLQEAYDSFKLEQSACNHDLRKAEGLCKQFKMDDMCAHVQAAFADVKNTDKYYTVYMLDHGLDGRQDKQPPTINHLLKEDRHREVYFKYCSAKGWREKIASFVKKSVEWIFVRSGSAWASVQAVLSTIGRIHHR